MSCSNSSSVMYPASIILVRSCSKFARNRDAPGDPESHMKLHASAATLTSPCARSPLKSWRAKSLSSAPRACMTRLEAVSVFRRTSPGFTTAFGGMEEASKSSSTSQPPGFRAATMRARAFSRSGRCNKTRRECTRSKAASGKASLTISWRRTSRLGICRDSRKRGSMSVTRTRPAGLTRAASQAAMEPPPPPTSRQCQPEVTPRFPGGGSSPDRTSQRGRRIALRLLSRHCRARRPSLRKILRRLIRYSSIRPPWDEEPGTLPGFFGARLLMPIISGCVDFRTK